MAIEIKEYVGHKPKKAKDKESVEKKEVKSK